MSKEYEVAKKASKKVGCYLPKEHEFNSMIADTPAYIRYYFEQVGWNIAMKEQDDSVEELKHWIDSEPLMEGISWSVVKVRFKMEIDDVFGVGKK